MFWRARQAMIKAISGSIGLKGWYELQYWKKQRSKEPFNNPTVHEEYFTSLFELDKSDYAGKKICDIGCGPRGSLEWADVALERIGVDPLADEYLKLNNHKHQMKYVKANSENLPFPDGYFDVVSSINSLDHVDNLDETIQEIIRVTKPGGLILLITDIHKRPTTAEPQTFSWDIGDRFKKKFEVILEKHLEKQQGGHLVSLKRALPFDHENTDDRYGIYQALFKKKADDEN